MRTKVAGYVIDNKVNGVPDLRLEEVWNVEEGVGRRVRAVVERGVRLYSTQYYHGFKVYKIFIYKISIYSQAPTISCFF